VTVYEPTYAKDGVDPVVAKFSHVQIKGVTAVTTPDGLNWITCGGLAFGS
jgi:hypothetical protein